LGQSLRQLMIVCKDVFRLKLDADPPANVKPLVIKLRDGAETVRMSARKYAPPQLKFMRDKIRELEELGLVLFCHPDQCSLTNSYVDNNSSLISE
jgi:hypothetical protein